MMLEQTSEIRVATFSVTGTRFLMDIVANYIEESFEAYIYDIDSKTKEFCTSDSMENVGIWEFIECVNCNLEKYVKQMRQKETDEFFELF